MQKHISYSVNKDRRVKFIFYGDVHLGHKLCSKKLFQKELIDRYKDNKDIYYIDMGDCLDLIVAQTSDRRFKASMIDDRYVGIDNPIDLMIDDYCELVEPIKDRILCLVDSNHHLSIMDRTGTDPTRRIAYKLWPDTAEDHLLGYSGFLVIRFQYDEYEPRRSRTRSYTISLCHGIGTGGKTEGGFMTTLGNDAVNYIADCHVFAHNHRLAGWDRIKIGVNSKATKIISCKEIRLNTGTYLKSFSDDTSTSFAERSRFKPGELGHIELNFRFNTNNEEVYWVKRAFL